MSDTPSRPTRPIVIAHRGASAYAPEHTLEAYELGIAQGADFIEPDLQITADGVLIALHDFTLQRTTDVRDVFPDRYREGVAGTGGARVWVANDFTFEEISQLDAGSWFDASFSGAAVPALSDVIRLARGRAGIFPETKAPDVYGSRGFDMEALLVGELRRHGLDQPGADPATPVVIQSFSRESLEILRGSLKLDLPSVLLLDRLAPAEWLTPAGFADIRRYATGIGPAKDLLLESPELVERAHTAGLTVVPWTFRSRNPGRFDTVEHEMSHYLHDLGVDGVFTDNPDLVPRERVNGGA